MKQELLHNGLLVGAMILASVITRFLPFFLFPAGKKTPRYITFLSQTLPYAAIALLVVYCLKDISFEYPYGIPEFLSVGIVVLLHLLKGNSLLSIGAGTACYMFLVQAIF